MNQVLVSGGVGVAPAYSATPQVTSINFGGSSLSSYVGLTSFTPTLLGASVAGTTTYSVQQGYYIRIGDLVFATVDISISAATGTGNATIGSLPFTSNSSTNFVALGAATINAPGWTWQVGTTSMSFRLFANASSGTLVSTGSAVNSGVLQMTNASAVILASIVYSV